MVPRNFHVSCFAGVVPNQYPIFKSVMKLPAIDSAVHTTPPIISAASIPPGPFKPTVTITTLAKISVINVMPETGLLPTIAIAFAATVVKRKAIMVTNKMPTTAKSRLPSITPNQKNANVKRMVTILPTAIILNEMSRCVRLTSVMLPPLPFNSFEARPTALLIMPQLLIIPSTPDIAIPPIPILRAYDLKISSGAIEPTVAVMLGSHMFRT